MSKKDLYTEALADARRVRELATRDASLSVMEVLTPKIRSLVEEQLLGESSVDGPPRILPDQDDINDPDNVDQTILCDDQGFDSEVSYPADEEEAPVNSGLVGSINDYESNISSIAVLEPLLQATKLGAPREVEFATRKLAEEINKFKKINSDILKTKHIKSKLVRMIEGIENMYDYVQEVVSDPAMKSKLSERLEIHYQDLEQLREDAMNNSRRRRQLREADEDLDVGGNDSLPEDGDDSDASTRLSLNIDVPSNLADDLVDALGEIEVELEDGEGEDDFDAAEEIDDSEEVEIDMDDSGDDDSVDFDVDADAVGDEGDDGEELQLNGRALSDDTIVEIDEAMLRRELRRSRLFEKSGFPTPTADGFGVDDEDMDDFGGGADEGEPMSDLGVRTSWPGARNSLKEFRRRLYENKMRRARIAEIRKSQRGNSSRLLTKGSNNSSQAVLLRRKLAESNLGNVKLQYANKLLQTSIPNNKKLQIVDQLDEAKTIREAKLIFESAVKLVAGNSVQPRRGNAGSASRVTRSGSAKPLNEGFEMNRWQRLAGLK